MLAPWWVVALGVFGSGVGQRLDAAELTLERMFAVPDLTGPTLRSAQFSPDGRLVAYLQGSADDKDRLDLWAYDVVTRNHRLLIDARALAPEATALSTEEAARRERMRSSSLRGILEYQFSSDSKRVLVPLNGDVYVYDLTARPAEAVRKLNMPGSATDARFSPHGHFASYVRDENLYIYELATGHEARVTPNCQRAISCGVAEFVAQEEMDRFTGYWWSPDELRIAWTQVDESPVAQLNRFEIEARDVRVVQERYPEAGRANASVRLFVSKVAARTAGGTTLVTDSEPVEMSFAAVKASAPGATAAPAAAPPAATAATPAPVPEYYLARVDWFPDSHALAVQRETRDQKTLDLLRLDAATGVGRVLLSEHSDAWIELNDELTFIHGTEQFLWASERTGFRHLYLYDFAGTLLRPVTAGDWMVVGDRRGRAIRGVDPKRGLVYFEANRETPVERNLYVTEYDRAGAAIRRLTTAPGWHGIQMTKDTTRYLDRYSTVEQPPAVSLRSLSGRVLAELAPNRLNEAHPYFSYLDTRPHSEFGTLAAEDGQTLHYQLLTPPHLEPGRRYPVIIEVYGGPGVQFVSNSWGDQSGFFEQILVEHGFLVFKLDNRGGGDRGARFASVLYRSFGAAEVRDQLRGVDWLKRLPYVDGGRIGMFGWSYGGYLTLQCLLQAPAEFAAGVAGAPVTDWRRYDTHYTERYLGTPEEDLAAYDSASVLPRAAALRTPLLLMHGMADDNVLFTNTTALMQRLQDLDKPFELMTYPGAKHSLLRDSATGPHAYETILGFLEAQLLAPRPLLPRP
jgi:dipeptidyl-peptidase-4